MVCRQIFNNHTQKLIHASLLRRLSAQSNKHLIYNSFNNAQPQDEYLQVMLASMQQLSVLPTVGSVQVFLIAFYQHLSRFQALLERFGKHNACFDVILQVLLCKILKSQRPNFWNNKFFELMVEIWRLNWSVSMHFVMD